ncbi:Spermatogenesis-associated protein 1-like, partial [Homarus americanus]
GEARQRALAAEREARLTGSSDSPLKPNIEILSLDGVIGGLELRDEDGNVLTSKPDQMELTYEIQVDERRVPKVGRDGENGRGAWESDGEDDGDLDGRSSKRVSRHNMSRNGQTTQEKLSSRLGEVLQEKAEADDLRQKLFNKARDLHEQIVKVREKRRQEWWTAWSEARRTGTQLEDRQAGLRNELDTLHRRIIGSIIKREPLITGVRDEPSRRANYKISVIRLRHEIEDLRRRVEAMEIKVEAEMKLRTQAEREVKTLRSEVSRKKANVALTQRATTLRSLSGFLPDLLVRI